MRVPLEIGAGSLTILAFSSEKERETILKSNRLRFPQYNSRIEEDMRSKIRKARRLGYAVSEGNVMPGATAVGVPIFDPGGRVVAAISVSAVSQGLNKSRRAEIAKLLKKEISAVHMPPAEEQLI
jgi:DNA-binding IclR family transcriptional regulator